LAVLWVGSSFFPMIKLFLEKDFKKDIMREKEIGIEREKVRAIGHTSGHYILLGVLSLLKICLEKEKWKAIKTIIRKNCRAKIRILLTAV